ncbi:MAG: hypothetical protein ACRD9L_23825 [Bryobacteraceae bacterium]
MNSHLRFIICCLLLALPAAAQLDSSALRVKYGSPLNRETFRLPQGFDLIVDYGAGNQVCQLQVPALMPTNEQVSRAADMKQRMYDFLAELVPGSMRGKEIGRIFNAMGAISMSLIEYEHVNISESQHGQPFDRDDTITVTFKTDGCH